MRTDISAGQAGTTNGQTTHLDVVVVGGGFSGCYLLHKLREQGFRTCVIEAASGLGGVWQWNCYPGARVDTHVPLYEYSIPEVWKTWNWTQRFPAAAELVAYFKHVDKVLDLSKDVVFNTKITTAEWDNATNKWTITTEAGAKYVASYFIPAMGFAAKRSFPNWPGLEKFKGEIHHSSFWPTEGVNVDKKRVAVVGTGSTGVQITQELAPKADNLVLFQRTPNMALPLRQVELTPEMQTASKPIYPAKFAIRPLSIGGYDFSPADINTFDHTPEERQAFLEDKWLRGGFLLWSGQYKDVLVDIKANRETYNFWTSKIRPLIKDPVKRDLVAPLKPPHPFGTKRTALFTTYYDAIDRDNVQVVDIRNNPVQEVTETGIVTQDGKHHDVDIIALATGFDAITGSLKQITVRGSSGQTLNEKWASGTRTVLGLMTSDFPNMFFTYGPQGPTAFSNGPTIIQMQSDWIVDLLVYSRTVGVSRIDPTLEGEKLFSKQVNDLTYQTLLPLADSFYMGANVEGKVREPLNFPAGVPVYHQMIIDSAANGYRGFKLSPAAN
ncbi:hypothetical protein FQN55_009399 [Onygenales sp. PD_40]|nr:hypothetical protein FQN55_009399 [Onygenales sp. PD_40]